MRLFDYSASYLGNFSEAPAVDLPDIPLLFKETGYQQSSLNRALVCEARPGAETLAHLVAPLLEADWSSDHHIFHDHAPPGKKTEFPGIVFNRFGKGVSIFIAVPLLESFSLQPNPWYRNLVRTCLRLLQVPRSVIIEGPSSARVVVTEDYHGWLLHLIRLQQETNGILLEEEGSIDIACFCNPPWPVAGVYDAVTEPALSMKMRPLEYILQRRA